MLETTIRPYYQQYLLDPIAQAIKLKVSPNTITLLAGFFGVLIPYFLARGDVGLALVMLLFSGFLDTLDGTLARLRQSTTPLGTVLDISVDRLVEFSVVYGFFLQVPARSGLCLLMLGSILLCVTTFLVVGIFSDNQTQKSFYYSPGLIERPEAFIFFVLMMLLPQYFSVLAIGFILLVTLTALIRVWQFGCQVDA